MVDEFQCIYCMQIKPSSECSHKEHVIPQSFGKFNNNFTLDHHVCNTCNQHFGDTFELDLAKDTLEGLSRFKYGVKQPSKFKSLGKRSRLIIKVAEGPFKGIRVYVEYSPDLGDQIIRPFPQIGVYHPKNAGYSYFLYSEIPQKSELEEQGFDLTKPNSFKVNSLDVEQAKEILRKKGFDVQFTDGEVYVDQVKEQWNVDIERIFDSILRRAIAKIAFNYFAYWNGSDIARQVDFDNIRSFILNEVEPSYPIVKILNKPILADESMYGQARLGHIITLNWSKEEKSIYSMVSLFNILTYSVSVTSNYEQSIQNLTRGHFFNIGDRKIYQLQTG